MLKRISSVLVVVLVVMLLAVPAFAAATTYTTHLEILAGVTGRTQSSITQERRNTGKSYITIAYDAGKLQEYKDEEIKMMTDRADADVKNGRISQDEADDIINDLTEKQKNYESYAKTDSSSSGSSSTEEYRNYSSDGRGYGYGHGGHRNYNSDGSGNYNNSHRGHCRNNW